MLKLFLFWLVSEIVGAVCWLFLDDVIDAGSVLLFGIVFVILVIALLYVMLAPYMLILDLSQFNASPWGVLLGIFAGVVSFGLMAGLVALIRRIFE